MADSQSLSTEPLELEQCLIDDIEVEVEVRLGEARLTVAELTRLATGDVVPIDRKISETLDIRVNGRVIARGEIVTVDGCFAVRVTEIGD